MPLSPEIRTRLQSHTGAAATVSDDELVASAATVLDAQAKDMKSLAGNATKVTALSADVTRLTGELAAAKADAEAKGKKVIELSAGPRKMDPLDLAEIAEQFDQKAEAVIAAGAPAKAVERLAALFKDGDGMPTVLALSACAVPTGDDAKTTRQKRLGIAVLDTMERAFKGDFGEGVPLGQAKKVVTLSGDKGKDEPKQLTQAEYMDEMAKAGHSVTTGDYQKYVARRGAAA